MLCAVVFEFLNFVDFGAVADDMCGFGYVC
jgi:hypothetical protein